MLIMKTGFTPISIDEFVKSTVKLNPKENPKELRQRLLKALQNYKEGVTCHCGNEIWVAGSAFVGNGCFTCITGEAYPDNDYEIKEAIKN